MWKLSFTSNTGYLGMERGESINLSITECSEQAKKEATQKAIDYLAKRQERPSDNFREFALKYVAVVQEHADKPAFIEKLKAELIA